MILEVKVPSPGESITEVEIETWLVESGSFVEMDDELAEINSDKATLTVNAEKAGVIEILAEPGEAVEVGQVIAKIDTEAKASSNGKKTKEEEKKSEKSAEKESANASESKEQNAKTEKSYAEGVASPSAEKRMKESGIDPKNIKGTGRDGRITKTDVIEQEKSAKSAPEKEEKPEKKTEKRPIPDMPVAGGTEERTQTREKMSTLRRKIAARLVSVKNETAMLTTFNEVDLHELMELRKKYKEKFKETHGVGLGFMSFFTKACTMALMDFPGVNAQIEDQEIVYHNYADIGIAVSTDRGLVVPIIRNAHAMTLWQIEQAVLHYALKARENKISIEDMQGGTFSITNGGVFGSMLSTPIINPPQAAILGMHNIVERPFVVEGEIKIRPIMYVALSYDHRIIDGKEAVSFLFRVKELLEDPARMLLGV